VYTPEGFALEIFKKRYTIHEEETWEEACDRVASHVASAEDGSNIPKYKNMFADILKFNLFMPGGRIWYGSGRSKGQLLNCFVVPTKDSREGWGKTVSDMIVISGTGGGVGMNFSPVRPRGSKIAGTGGFATGAVSLMSVVNSAGEEIKGGGGRRTALMFCLNLTHGDIEEFLDKKLDLQQLNNANVSVVFDQNPEDFFNKVKNDENIQLNFNGHVVREIPAKRLWYKIVENALKSGEPGLLNGYFANKMSNIWYYKPLISTNPCGEIWMPEYDCCCLGALVLPRFLQGRDIPGDKLSVDWQLLKDTVHSSVRFLDDVLTVNNYPLPEISETCKTLRRIGLGIMGLHDMLLMLGHKYNSPAALEFVNKLMNFIKNAAYEASIELAKEKGPFLKFDKELFMKSGFVKTLKPTVRDNIKLHGIRNCALLTLAPTGTTAMTCGVTSGIEPMFAAAYERRWWNGDKREMEVVVHPLFKQFVESGKDVSHFQGSHDLNMRDHFEMQRVCQKHIDNAVSKTINLVQGTSVEELSELYMEYLPELKGVTVYPEGSRENQPLTPLPLEEAMQHASAARGEATSQDSCKSGVCDV
jgi:ribonucleoside-diphosphate reductase alpha chain